MTEDHAAFDELAVGWALHALEPEDEAVFARHLGGCVRCAQTVAETTEVMGAMAADLPQVAPSDALGSRVRDAVAGTEQVHRPVAPPVPAATPPMPLPRRGRRPRRALAAALVAAVVAAVAGLGIWTVVLTEDRRELQATVAEQREVMDLLLTPGRATIAPLARDGRPVATVVARDDVVQVITHGLEVNDAGSTTYVVWGLGGDEPEALGTFDVDRSQMSLLAVGSGLTGLDDFAQYGISIEPGQEPPSEPTEVVAIGQVTS
ncbi:anti-sigma factor domain-containing protein [Blastococcus mobilis]|uniref:Regulator of SigK n=1 Tax=Blastococcus mobilis TaxID=1938746 RepID=A0A238VF17_9ACTN|nr:anti-sigma factor [Blastococcus mobilis]SNR32657.1 Anti-sigma-K factor rskA [Blastococcus mobilis]